jgi:peptidoglycan/xylan/chitin deacetylase (PgdA/CDA1 family)
MSPARLLGGLIRWSGLALVIRRLYARRRASIILYHDPAPETLERHLRYLGQRYTLIGLGQLVDALRSGRWSSLPPRPLVITIDDGLAGNAALAGVFERHGVRPTIFICTQIVATDRHFWFLDAGPQLAERLKAVPDAERLAELERVTGFRPEEEYGPGSRQALTRSQVEAMREICDFESHTRFHPLLPQCTAEDARTEIIDSRAETESLSGSPCRHLAYPLGAYSAREVELARQAGYHSARTVDIGWNGPRTDPYRLKILSVADFLSETMLAAELTGLKWLVRLLRREGRLDGSFSPPWRART